MMKETLGGSNTELMKMTIVQIPFCVTIPYIKSQMSGHHWKTLMWVKYENNSISEIHKGLRTICVTLQSDMGGI